MRKLIFMLVLLPTLSIAQATDGMPQDVTKMIMQAQKAQACMENIDKTQMEKFENAGTEMESEIQGLCDSGKRDEAQALALDYSREMINSDTMQEIRKCTELMREVMPELPFDNIEEKMASTNICDEMK